MNYDLVIIGAGPAGMAAAVEAGKSGARVLLLDEQGALGGQIYRGIERADARRAEVLGADYRAGRKLAEAVRLPDVDYVPNATVWQVTDRREVGYSVNGKARLIRAPWVLIATGAMERPFPVPGWTLPGVMMAGAAQVMLKESGLAADGAVFAGGGPLLYLIAHQYLQAGIKPAAVLDTTPRENRWSALKHVPGALRRWDMLSKGRRWLSEIRKSGTPVIGGVTELRIEGDTAAEAVAYRTADGGRGKLTTTNVFLHQGVVPNVNLTMAAGIGHDWDERQLCWRPVVDGWGRTDIDGLLVAGDGGGVGGARAAEAGGRLAALGVMEALGRITPGERDSRAAAARTVMARERAIRPFLDVWFRPADRFRVPTDADTVVCRCEELTAGDIRDVITVGLEGPNQLKSFCRAGMGPCQGRFCGLTVQELIAAETARQPGDVGYYRLRPPIKPLSLNELADLEADAPGNET